jgi:transketolase C-terminal domain/subunit
VGTEDWLKEEYGLTAADIIDRVKRVLPRRKRRLFSW